MYLNHFIHYIFGEKIEEMAALFGYRAASDLCTYGRHKKTNNFVPACVHVEIICQKSSFSPVFSYNINYLYHFICKVV